MSSKLVYVYLVTYVEEEWAKYRQEIEDVQLTVVNFTVSIPGMDFIIKNLHSVFILIITDHSLKDSSYTCKQLLLYKCRFIGKLYVLLLTFLINVRILVHEIV